MNSPKTDALMRNPTRDGNDLPDLCREMEAALRLAHSIFAKLPPTAVERAANRAAIKHTGNDPMGYIAGVLG